jgi:hypothetical protein
VTVRDTNEFVPELDESDAAFEALLSETRREPHELHLAGFAARTADRAMAWRDRSLRGLWWSLPRGIRLGVTFSSALAALALAFVAMPARPGGATPPGEGAPVAVAQVESDDSDVDDVDPDDDATADDDCDESADEQASNKVGSSRCTTTTAARALPSDALLTEQELDALTDLYLPYPS